jgi:hypothetical protein
MARKWSSVMVKALIGGRNLLTAWPYMLPEAERPMDGEMS